jgi:large subunit ribosomal protein L15
MMLHEITAQAGAHKPRMRVGRGESSGKGKTCGRGNKGLQSRAGGGTRRLTEGGQMPLVRRLPKRGFSNVQFRVEYEIVNVGQLGERFKDGETVNPDALRKQRLVRAGRAPVRVLGAGALARKLTVEAHAFSAKAKELIESAGGTARVIEQKSAKEKATCPCPAWTKVRSPSTGRRPAAGRPSKPPSSLRCSRVVTWARARSSASESCPTSAPPSFSSSW